MGVLSQLPLTRKVGHVHQQPDSLHVAVELEYLGFVLPAHSGETCIIHSLLCSDNHYFDDGSQSSRSW